MKYRLEIDGLRAIAVLAVVFYHAGVHGFDGGYVGVDVFFAISGFLICKIMIEKQENNVFSYINFLFNRVRRLAPSAFVVVLCTSAWAFGNLYVQEFFEYGKSLLAFMVFASNWFFLSEATSYFSAESEVNLLLHTWSLGIEEQFYIVYPLLLALIIKKFNMSAAIFITIIVSFLSFFYSFYLVSIEANQVAAFYNTLARVWEMSTGCLLAFIENPLGRTFSRRNVVFRYSFVVFSILLIVYPIFSYNKTTIFPSLNAVPAVIGTLLFLVLIRYTYAAKLFCIAPLRYIGKISYPLYLWHWPLLLIASTMNVETDIAVLTKLSRFLELELWKICALSLCFILSVLTYHCIERPIRRGLFLRRLKKLMAMFFFYYMLMVLFVFSALNDRLNYFRSEYFFGGLGVVLNSVHQARIQYFEFLRSIHRNAYDETKNSSAALKLCSYDNSDVVAVTRCLNSALQDPSYLVIGDSMGRDVYLSLLKAYPNERIVMLHQSSCLPVDFHNAVDKNCFNGLESIINNLAENRRVLGFVLSGRLFFEDVDKFISGIGLFERLNLPFVVVAGAPSFLESIGKYVVKKYKSDGFVPLAVPIDDTHMYRLGQQASLLKLKEAKPKLQVFDAYAMRCGLLWCDLFVSDMLNQPIIFDREHLTLYGIESQAAVFSVAPVLKKFFTRPD